MKIIHGTYAGYTKGCRCEDCKEARREYRRSKADSRATDEPGRVCRACGCTFHRPVNETRRRFSGREFCSVPCARAAHDRWQGDPAAIGLRTAVAVTCPKCGDLLSGSRLRRDQEGFIIRTCGPCRAAQNAEAMDEVARARVRDANTQSIKRLNDESRRRAFNAGRQWTGPELEVASRDDLSVAEMAALLGRSYEAVVHARHKVRRDPKWERVAGLSVGGGGR